MWMSDRKHWAQQSNLLNVIYLATLVIGFSLASWLIMKRDKAGFDFLACVLLTQK